MNSLLSLCRSASIELPLPSQILDQDLEHAVYSRFMRYLRCVPSRHMAGKVRSSIHFTADILDYSDAHIAKVLVELGLRGPRAVFPDNFLEYADQALLREPQDIGGPSAALIALGRYWNVLESGDVVSDRRQYSLPFALPYNSLSVRL